MQRSALVALVLAASASTLPAQPVLVKDIRPAPAAGSALPDFLHDAVPLGGRLYFPADDGFFGEELWRSDGTAVGTRLVADVCPGRCSSRPERLIAAAGLLFFLAHDESRGMELWRSDGTGPGTFPLVDAAPGPDDGAYGFLARYGSRLIFATPAGDSSWNLWASDGTPEGTHPFTEVHGIVVGFQQPAQVGGVLVFAFFVEGQGVELWRTDGTAAGTGPLTTIDPGSGNGVDPGGFAPTPAGGRLYFAGDDGFSGLEPWTTDGTAAGTRRLAELAPGGTGSFPFGFTVRDGEVVFVAETPATGRELFRTDGTEAGTRLVADLRPGPEGSTPAIVASARGRLLFVADDGARGLEPWLIAASGAVLPLGDLHPGPAGSITLVPPPSAAAGGLFYFPADDGSSGRELWRTDGSPAGTRRLEDLTPGPASSLFGRFHPVGTRVLFAFGPADRPLVHLGATAGTPESTGIVTAIHRQVGSSDPRQLTALGPRALFVANDGVHGLEVWTSDGTRRGTALLGDLDPQNFDFGPTELTAPFFDRAMFFTGGGTAIWSTRGLPGDARLLRGRQRFLHGLEMVHGNAVFFGSEHRDGAYTLVVWRSDGTPQGTRRVETVARAESPFDTGGNFFAVSASDSAHVYFVPHLLFDFVERAGGLWVSDGTAAGTFEAVADPCGGCDAVGPLQAVGHTGRLFYLAAFSDVAPQRTELWTSDTTPAGTHRLLQAIAFDGPVFGIRELVTLEFSVRAFFVVEDLEHGTELWTSDGTPAGTRLVADLRPGPDSSAPAFLTPLGDRVFFAADDGVHGRELWVSDGTAAGTHMVQDIRPGARSSHPAALRVVDGRLVFAADDGVHGLEPWRSDGTFAGTFLLGDVLPGVRSSSPRDFVAVGEWLLFNAGRPLAGYELFRLPRAALDRP